MSKLKPALFALSLMLVAPAVVQAADITLIPAVKLQIGDRDDRGQHWDGGAGRGMAELVEIALRMARQPLASA